MSNDASKSLGHYHHLSERDVIKRTTIGFSGSVLCVSTRCPVLQVAAAVQLAVSHYSVHSYPTYLQTKSCTLSPIFRRSSQRSKRKITILRSDPLCFLLYKNKTTKFTYSVICVTKQNIIICHLRSSYSSPAILRTQQDPNAYV